MNEFEELEQMVASLTREELVAVMLYLHFNHTVTLLRIDAMGIPAEGWGPDNRLYMLHSNPPMINNDQLDRVEAAYGKLLEQLEERYVQQPTNETTTTGIQKEAAAEAGDNDEPGSD